MERKYSLEERREAYWDGQASWRRISGGEKMELVDV